jgi:hypothetical protein
MGLMGPMKFEPHFMNGSTRNMVISFAIGVCKKFSIRMHHGINNANVHPCVELGTILGIQHLSSYDVNRKMSATNSFLHVM